MLLRFWPKTSMWITSEACVMWCVICSVLWCDVIVFWSYTRVVLIHWTLRRPLLCFAGVGTRNYYRKMGYELEGPYMVKDLYEPRNDWTWTVSHLDTVTSGQQLHRHKLFYLSRHCFTDSSCSSFSGTWSLFPALEEMIVGFSVTVFAFYLVHTLLL